MPLICIVTKLQPLADGQWSRREWMALSILNALRKTTNMASVTWSVNFGSDWTRQTAWPETRQKKQQQHKRKWKKTCNHIVERECGYSTSWNRVFMKHHRIGQCAYIELWMHAWSWRAGTSKPLNTKLTVFSTSLCIPQTSKETGLYHSSPSKFSIWMKTAIWL